MAQWQQLYEFWCKAGLLKGKKTPESNKTLKARVTIVEAKTENDGDENLFADEKPKANNRNIPA